jgi:hypothetical protein
MAGHYYNYGSAADRMGNCKIYEAGMIARGVAAQSREINRFTVPAQGYMLSYHPMY